LLLEFRLVTRRPDFDTGGKNSFQRYAYFFTDNASALLTAHHYNVAA